MPFDPQHFTSGPVVPCFGVSANDLVKLGYSEDGIKMLVTPYFDNIPSDDFGGRGGPPSDAQILGAIATIDLELSKYVKADVDRLSSFQVAANAIAGVLPPIGKFVRQDGLGGVLKLIGINDSYLFDFAYLRRNYEINTGTKWRKYILGFEAWMSKPNYEQLAQAQDRRLFTLS